MKMRMFCGMTAVLILAAGAAMAAGKPFQASLTPDIALYDRTETIEGFALSVWGENPQRAFALGIVNGSTGRSVGLSVGALNYAEHYTGFQLGLVNVASGDVLGWQHGFVNYTDGFMTGLQSGCFNYARSLTGVQFGWVNCALMAQSGVQIGLVNIMPTNPWFSDLPNKLAPGMIFVNWRF